MSSLREEFADRGVVRIPNAFLAEAAAAIADTVWGSVERRSDIRRDDASTWPNGGGASGLSFKNLKGRRAFEPVVRSEPVQAAFDELLGVGAWTPPPIRAQILLSFPSPGPWVMPSTWHIDGGFDAPTWPPPAIRMFSCFDTVAPEGGGTLLLEGSHRLVERYMAEQPAPIAGNSVTWGRFLRHHPALEVLRRRHTPDAPRRDLVGATIDVDGVDVRVVQVTGSPGDLYLAHFHVFHTGAPNVSARPRQMLSTTVKPRNSEIPTSRSSTSGVPIRVPGTPGADSHTSKDPSCGSTNDR